MLWGFLVSQTSLITAVAGELRLSIYMLRLSGVGIDDEVSKWNGAMEFQFTVMLYPGAIKCLFGVYPLQRKL